jgi:metallophosphoesterase (TIGR03767 family)
VAAQAGRQRRRKALLAFAQITDVHVVDAQSPARVEWFDRYDNQYQDSDPTTGLASSAYRPQEMLTAQVAEAMVRAINKIGAGPVTGRALAFTLQTGDNSDNSQHNEIRWNIDILDGGRLVTPDSGDLTRYEGVPDDDPTYYDTHYWHPDTPPTGKPTDIAKQQFGFPTIQGLLDAARRPFGAQGLKMPWYTAFGNHDQLVQGNFPASTMQLNAVATGGLKVMSPPPGMSQADLIKAVTTDFTFMSEALTLSPYVRAVTPDADRRLLSRREVVEEHFRTTGTPVGHGFTTTNRTAGTAYYTFTKGNVLFIVLDTVNPNGYADGSLDQTQFAWLQQQLAASTGQLVVVASHHTSDTMANPFVGTGTTNSDDTGPRVMGDEVLTTLHQFKNVIAWVNGHTHRNQVWARPNPDGTPGGFWEINTASHVDWPQQSRLLEIVDNGDGTLSIFATMVDHAGPASFGGQTGSPVPLAGLARELAANDWQERTTGREGDAAGRNVELLVANPL